jgi:putative endopeptidase
MIRLNFQNIMLFASTVFAAACSNAPKAEKKADVAMEKTKIPGFDTSSLDRRYRAQDDFDSFANGGWKKLNPIPSTEGNWGAFGIIDKENSEVKLKGIIESTITGAQW